MTSPLVPLHPSSVPFSIPSAASFVDHLIKTSQYILVAPELRPNQIEGLLAICLLAICDNIEAGGLIDIIRTGAGKTHAIHVLEMYARVISPGIHPIIALMADLVLKFLQGTTHVELLPVTHTTWPIV